MMNIYGDVGSFYEMGESCIGSLKGVAWLP